MNFEDYEDKILERASYPNMGNNLTYPVLGINGEAGEVAEKLKKIIRDKSGVISKSDRIEIAKELGDVLWYLTMCCRELGISISEVAAMNLQKIDDRHKRNVCRGSGDNR